MGWLASDADLPPDVKVPTRIGVHVVAIGISAYRSSDIPPIPHAAHDAKMFARFLQEAGGVPKGRVRVLANEEATRGTITGVLKDWLGRHVQEDHLVLVYYAGHGAPDPKGEPEAYFVPYDGDPQLPSTLLSRREVAELLKALPTKKALLILDSCFSGKGRSVVLLAEGGRPIVAAIESPYWQGVTVLAAASWEQISNDYEPGKHGLFTYYLLKGMQGEADSDQDGEVELEELYRYVREQVQQKSLEVVGREQTPTVVPEDSALSIFANFFLTRLR